MKFEEHEVDRHGWTAWIRPKPLFRARCCDCALVHDFQFKVHDGRVIFRARRNVRLTNDSRKEQKFKGRNTKIAGKARKAAQVGSKGAVARRTKTSARTR